MACATAVLGSDDLEMAILAHSEKNGKLPEPVKADRAVFGVDTKTDFKKGARIPKKDGMT